MRLNKQKSSLLRDKLSLRMMNKSIKYKFGKLLIASISYMAILLCLLSMFELRQVTLLSFLPGLVVLFLLTFYRSGKAQFIIFSILIFLMFSFFFIQRENILNGLFLLMNQAAETIGRQTGIILSQYEITADANLLGYAASSFWACFSIIISVFCYFTLKYKRNILLWVFIMPLFIIQLVTDIMPSISYNLLLFLSAVLLMSDRFVHYTKKRERLGTGRTASFISTVLIIALIFSIVFTVLNAIVPAVSYTKPAAVKNMEQYLIKQMKDFRFEKKQTNTFTQGDFSRIEDLELLDEAALEVIMDQPTSLYLRGFVGSAYTGERWEALNEEVQYDSYNLFYWLNYEGFHPLNQLSLVSDINDDEANDVIQMKVNNLNASSNYIYTPYELLTPIDEMMGTSPVEGSMLKADSFFGERFYSFEARKNLVSQYPALANQIYRFKESGREEQYLNQENHYNEFVYEFYTAVPEQLAILLENHLEVTVEGEGQHISYEQAIDFVKTYLNQTLEYTVNASPVPDGNDFLTYLFENTQSGYATHFATAGTMIFRYLGVPARYVEGYLVTPKDIQGKMDYEKITLKGTNAHAWTEIYLDEVGWIPVEVTPPYYDVMEPTDLTDYPAGDVELNHANQTASNKNMGERETSKEVIEQEQPQSIKNQNPNKEISWLMKILFVFIAMITFLILGYIIYAAVNRRKLTKLKHTFKDSTYGIAIPNLFNYTMALLYYDGLKKHGGSTYDYADELKEMYSDDYVNTFKAAVRINQEARFSKNDISEEKYLEIYQFMKDTLKYVLMTKTGWQRFKMKFIDFIY